MSTAGPTHRPTRTRAVSLTCGVLTVGAVLVNIVTDQHFLALVLSVFAFALLLGYILGIT